MDFVISLREVLVFWTTVARRSVDLYVAFWYKCAVHTVTSYLTILAVQAHPLRFYILVSHFLT